MKPEHVIALAKEGLPLGQTSNMDTFESLRSWAILEKGPMLQAVLTVKRM